METQNQIKQKLSQPEAVEQICQLLNTNNNITRTNLADLLCEQFGFIDPRGEKQRAGCLRALRELEQKDLFKLPAPCHVPGKRNPIRLGKEVPEPRGVPESAELIRELNLVLVETDEEMRIWNELMFREHPRGATLLVGRQIRYLVKSEHGFLGGLSFSSSAIHLEDRDRWLGWDPNKRRDNLHYIINMSRFLIRPCVSCQNLASRVLGKVIREFPDHFEARYGYRPFIIESFVDTSKFTGTCYQASNWILIGQTKGRGRQDSNNEKAETIKDIYVYPLEKKFRNILDLPEDNSTETLDLTSGLDSDNWAKNEFGGAPLGDKRLSDRLVVIASEKAENPGRSYNNVAKGDWAKAKGYYRLIDKADDSAVTMKNILSPHRERTIKRMKSQECVLCIQDGTDLSYSNLDQCESLGIIGTNQTNAQSRGLHLHSTLALTTEGLPLGVLSSECSAPELKSKEDKRPSWLIPIEEKKTYCWIEGIQDSMNLKAQMPETSIINISDREADFFEMFDYHRSHCLGIDLLVRGKHDRATTGEHKLFETARESEVQAKLKINVPRQSARSKKSKQKARPKKPKREAELSLRYEKIKLNPPSYYKGKTPIPLWVVHVREDNPPAGIDPIEWFLLTTINIQSVKDALNCVKWYKMRWRIEDWHRVIKSGCKVEKLAHKTAKRLSRAIAIALVIAWRIMLMTLLGRETPDLPAEILFSDPEIEVLTAFAKKKAHSLPHCIGDAVKLVAKLGGYLGRSCDSPPGHQLMWLGYLKLQSMCEGIALIDEYG